MNFYNKYILPKILNAVMKSEGMEKYRPDVAAQATGIVLEIGFGSGLNLPYYQNITKLYALDPSVELWELAQERVKKVTFPIEHLEASAEQIPLGNSSVDTIISTWSLCSIPHPEIALKEMFRVLKVGGTFAFIEHGRSPRNFMAKLQQLLTPFSKCLAGGCHLDRDITTLMTDADFQIQKIEKIPQKSKPLVFMYKGVSVAKK